MPVPPEAHGLGPHVVGQRVVVRRILPGETGPSGGPAMTDLLGTCLAWGDGSCVVAPEQGDPVTIRLADIVSGKPVPPRPSPRLRVSPLEAQTRALALWPDLETEHHGAWLLRHSPTSTARRANSVLAFGPSGVEDDLDAVVQWYAGRTGRPIAAVITGSPEHAFFRDLGWGAESNDDDTLFQLASVASARRGLPEWEAILEEDGDLVVARIGDLASGVAAYADDWVGFRSIEVAESARRRGLGLQVMAALLEWGAERGARTAYLQVLGDNAPALSLYAGMGFVTHHAYRYLAPPTA
ncbi:GNAT family N-acetyltransferase [Nocardioides sp. LS1]|uniref:GNAT family N-acetyltransferase n=1 Tax=Nocardioides sp. LS1 TaxID=1027620 RepID=UPI000F61C755|nr:GNAT family N-acetyltransferase [Nocardioides sp. LS1]GCD91050.1 N-acetyltransferase [Nocardioides sp. LS1]